MRFPPINGYAIFIKTLITPGGAIYTSRPATQLGLTLPQSIRRFCLKKKGFFLKVAILHHFLASDKKKFTSRKRF